MLDPASSIDPDWSLLGDTELFDVFYETGTILCGTLLHYQRLSDNAGYSQLRSELFDIVTEIHDLRERIPANRASMISQIASWQAQRELVNRLLSSILPSSDHQ